MVGMHTHHRSPGRKAPGAQLGATQETILHTGPGRGGDAKPDQCGGPILPFEPVPPAERRTFVNGGCLCLGVSWNVFRVTEVSRETSRVLTLVICRWLGEPVTSRSLGRIDREMTQDPKQPTLWISSFQNRWEARDRGTVRAARQIARGAPRNQGTVVPAVDVRASLIQPVDLPSAPGALLTRLVQGRLAL